MTRALLMLTGPQTRLKARKWIDAAPDGTRVEFKKPRRTLDQNSYLWVLLTRIAEQRWLDGKHYSSEDMKDYFMHALKKGRWMPSEDGGYVPVGMRSSDLSKEEFSDLLEVVREHCARHGIETEPAESPAESEPI